MVLRELYQFSVLSHMIYREFNKLPPCATNVNNLSATVTTGKRAPVEALHTVLAQ